MDRSSSRFYGRVGSILSSVYTITMLGSILATAIGKPIHINLNRLLLAQQLEPLMGNLSSLHNIFSGWWIMQRTIEGYILSNTHTPWKERLYGARGALLLPSRQHQDLYVSWSHGNIHLLSNSSEHAFKVI